MAVALAASRVPGFWRSASNNYPDVTSFVIPANQRGIKIMKDDFSIKGEVIAALETINNPGSDQSIVDAHLVENVVVKAGIVDLTLVIDASRKREERFALEDAIAVAVEAIG